MRSGRILNLYEQYLDLWSYLANTKKAIVLYGMGNGADKILSVLDTRGVRVAGVFASDGFVRGQIFHQKRVLSWTEAKGKYGAENLIVLLSFGSSRPEVIELIKTVAAEAEI